MFIIEGQFNDTKKVTQTIIDGAPDTFPKGLVAPEVLCRLTPNKDYLFFNGESRESAWLRSNPYNGSTQATITPSQTGKDGFTNLCGILQFQFDPKNSLVTFNVRRLSANTPQYPPETIKSAEQTIPSFFRPRQFISSVIGTYQPQQWLSVWLHDFEKQHDSSNYLEFATELAKKGIALNRNTEFVQTGSPFLEAAMQTWSRRVAASLGYASHQVTISQKSVQTVFERVS